MVSYLPKALKKAIERLEDIDHTFLHASFQKQLYQIPVKEIRYMERTLRITNIYTGDASFQTSENFASLLQRLPGYFVSCQRSYIINLNYVTKLGRNEVVLGNNTTISVGKNYDELKQRFALHMTGKLL